MEDIRTTNYAQGFLWFGVSISIAEILAGALIAPLGLCKGIAAILLGHLIGGIIFYLTGYIGAEAKLPAIESTRISFGRRGSYLFSLLNIMQLTGWTAIMIFNASQAFDAITINIFNYSAPVLWRFMIFIFISLLIITGIKNFYKINILAISCLFIISIILSFTVFGEYTTLISHQTGSLSFGEAVELSVIMPISWLPLVSDYTRFLKKKISGNLIGTVSYFIANSWMYIIGLTAAMYTGTSDITELLMKAGLDMIAPMIILLSTISGTFMCSYSAGISFLNITDIVNEKIAALSIIFIGFLIASFISVDSYEGFLYYIGMVFSPLFAILITEYYFIGLTKIETSSVLNIKNIILWCFGVILYRFLMIFNTPLGITLPVMIIIALLSIIINWRKIKCLKPRHVT